MKKTAAIVLALCAAMLTQAQNLQVHYDFGKDRKLVTSTLEMFKPDTWGSTFFFVDMNYDADNGKTISLAYWEIARGIKLGKSPLAAHVEFNGGFGQFYTNPGYGAYPINNAWLLGIDYNYNNADFSKGFTLQALYKYINSKEDFSFQLTGVWYMHMLERKLTFSGFADFWKEENAFTTGSETTETTQFVFLSEPQLWYNVTSHLSAGGELELGSNFGGVKGFAANPTVALKWIF